MAEIVVHPSRGLTGELTPPGDKSLSHRAAMFSAIAEGATEITGFLTAADTLNTVRAMQKLGVSVEGAGTARLLVHGRGLDGLAEPDGVLDLGNSGTGMRLLAGLLAGQNFFSILTGDQYLLTRPMARIVEPLRSMHAVIDGRSGGRFAPLAIRGGGKGLKALDYTAPVASAQVKSALLLCGLYAEGTTSVTEPHKSRDHTERMLRLFGAEVRDEGLTVSVQGRGHLKSVGTIAIPSDISSAAFFMVAAAIVPGSDILIRNVGVNPTRTGVIDILEKMGADISVENLREQAGEPVADIRVKHRGLTAVTIAGEAIPRAIDDIPVISVAAACAKGKTIIRDAGELRVKESDRIATMAAELTKMGATVRERPDGMEITGKGTLEGARCESHGDHRVAMAMAVAGLAARGETVVQDTGWIETSFPGFEQMLRQSAG